MMAKNPFNRDKSDKETIATPQTAAEAFGDVDVSEAAAELMEAPSKRKVTTPSVAWEQTGQVAEKAAVEMFKFVKATVASAIEFNEEHDVIGKAKDAATKVIEFEKENEVLLKARAAVELGAEAANGAIEEAKKAKPLAKKAVPKAAKGAKTAAKKTKKTSGLPFDLPKF
jgi:hypothetical protein